MKSKRLKIIGVLALIVVALSAYKPSEKYFEIAKNLDIFATLFQEVNKYYVDEVSPTDLMKTGIDAMLSKLDPYTNYIPEDRIEDYRTMTTGVYGGIGAVVSQRNGKIVIVMPNEGYPADKAGLQIGDEILAIDDISLKGKNMNGVSKLLKGQANTEVKLQVKRYGKEEPITFNLKRERIKLKNVPYYGMVTEDIGLIQLTDFTQNASKEIKDAMVKLKAEGAKKLILDLRGNPGGLLSEAINISNLFLPKGSEIVSTKGKIKEWNSVHKASNAPEDLEIPVAVLINNNSASASEIVSGSLQDYDRAVIVGQRSYGKGLVQATRSLSYNSKLKVTVAKYYIPSGRCIQELDYTNRKADGTVEKMADSLRVAFKTKNGRVVYDGQGVSPDIDVDLYNYAPITRSLIGKGLIFEYATKFRFEHNDIEDAKTFSLSDAEYDKFINWAKNKDYEYKTESEASLDALIASAKKDKKYKDLAPKLTALRGEIVSDKKADLNKFRNEIKEELELEIISRYYWEKGRMEASFDDNGEINAAIKVLNDPARYQKILSGK